MVNKKKRGRPAHPHAKDAKNTHVRLLRPLGEEGTENIQPLLEELASMFGWSYSRVIRDAVESYHKRTKAARDIIEAARSGEWLKVKKPEESQN